MSLQRSQEALMSNSNSQGQASLMPPTPKCMVPKYFLDYIKILLLPLKSNSEIKSTILCFHLYIHKFLKSKLLIPKIKV